MSRFREEVVVLEKGGIEALKRELDETLAELGRLRRALSEEPDRTDDEVDLDIYEREKTLALVQNLERKLEDIEHAIQSAHQGRYGICESCGRAIDPERLAALPHATLCVECKTRLERRR